MKKSYKLKYDPATLRYRKKNGFPIFSLPKKEMVFHKKYGFA